MRTLLTAVALMALSASGHAQTANGAKPKHYSSSSTTIGTLLDDPAAKALLDRYIPGISSDYRIRLARGMTLKTVQKYSRDTITDKVLANLDTAFARIPARTPR